MLLLPCRIPHVKHSSPRQCPRDAQFPHLLVPLHLLPQRAPELQASLQPDPDNGAAGHRLGYTPVGHGFSPCRPPSGASAVLLRQAW